MTARARMAKVEHDLSGLATLHLIMEEIDQVGMQAYGQRIAERPVEEAPISRIVVAVDATVRAAMKGQPYNKVQEAVQRRTEEAIFLFILVMVINECTHETITHQGLLAAAVTFWMGALLGGPRSDELEPEDIEDNERCWARWRWAVTALESKVVRDDAARALLEERYLGGRRALLAEAKDAAESLREQVDILIRLAAQMPYGRDGGMEPVPGDTPEEEAAWLADRARVRTFDLLGDRESAVGVLERRILGPR